VTASFIIFQGWNLHSYLKEQRNTYLRNEEMFEFSKSPTPWSIIPERMTGNVVISKADAPMCVVLKKTQNEVSYGESVGTAECITL
jgi:hypothetical protein